MHAQNIRAGHAEEWRDEPHLFVARTGTALLVGPEWFSFYEVTLDCVMSTAGAVLHTGSEVTVMRKNVSQTHIVGT